jgi:hypothetical protein
MDQRPAETPGEDRWRVSTAQKRLIGFIVVLAVTNVAYRLVYATGTSRTAALYVGVPTILAVGLALLPHKGSATVALLKGAVLAVLIAGVVLPEGVLCLLFALPLVALVAVAVGGLIDLSRLYDRKRGPTLMGISLPLLLLSLEGVAGSPFETADRATATLTVAATPAEVATALAAPPRFEADLPAFLTIGFNRPVAATGAGTAVGDTRTIVFNGGTHDDHPLRLFGLTGTSSMEHHAMMQLSVVASSPGRVAFAVDRDATMLARWADLERAVARSAPATRRRSGRSWAARATTSRIGTYRAAALTTSSELPGVTAAAQRPRRPAGSRRPGPCRSAATGRSRRSGR